jgi:hypothetical protein
MKMKIFKNIPSAAIIIALAVACNDGIDPISSVPPGSDTAAPALTISYPFEGARIQVREEVAPVNIQFEATDDIEIKSIVLKLDGTQIAQFSDFKDYRRAVQTYKHPALTNGLHTVSVTVTDMSDKATTSSVSFEKVPPYQPKSPGEIFYMPFDNEYLELLTIKPGTTGGEPSFVDGIKGKAVRFDAANKGYVLFPGDTLAKASDFSLSFWVNAVFVDANADNGIDGVLGLVNLSNKKRFWGNFDFFVENGSNPAAAKMVVHVTNDDSETWINDGTTTTVAGFFSGWTHHAVTYDATSHEFKYYYNGTLKVAKAASWTDALTFKDSGPMVFGTVHFQTTPSLTTGSTSQPWASYLTGELDEVRIFNRALSAADVQQIYDDIN